VEHSRESTSPGDKLVGYSISQNAIARVRTTLDQMLAADHDLEWITPVPRLAYYIREGIAAARALGMTQYAELSGKYIIRELEGGRIKAELRNKLPDILHQELQKLVIREITGATAVVGAAIQNKRHEMFFPDAGLFDSTELFAVDSWAHTAGYFLIEHDGGAVTLTKDDPGELKLHCPAWYVAHTISLSLLGTIYQ